jgi:hypothetical protein
MRETITSILIGALAAVLVFASGYESGKTAERERMNEIVLQEQINHAKSVSEATNSLVTASNEYDAVKRERDALALKLRRATSDSSKGSAAGACEARVARLEEMVEQLHGLVERCDSGWHGCAARKDALSEAVK